MVLGAKFLRMLTKIQKDDHNLSNGFKPQKGWVSLVNCSVWIFCPLVFGFETKF